MQLDLTQLKNFLLDSALIHHRGQTSVILEGSEGVGVITFLEVEPNIMKFFNIFH